MAARKTSFSERFYEVIQKLFRELDQDAIRAEVLALRATKPRASRRELAMFMTRKAAQKTAVIGAAAGGTPGVFSLVVLAPDIFNLVRQQSRLVLSIAFLYEQKPNLRERFREVLATLAIASGASVTKKGTQLLVSRSIRGTAVRQLARRIAGKYFGRKLYSVAAPAIGFMVGGAVNYLSVRAVGIAAQKYYSQLLRQQQSSTRKRRIIGPTRSSRPSSRKKRAAGAKRSGAGRRARR